METSEEEEDSSDSMDDDEEDDDEEEEEWEWEETYTYTEWFPPDFWKVEVSKSLSNQAEPVEISLKHQHNIIIISIYNLLGQVESSKAGYEDGCDSGWAHSYHEVMMMIMILRTRQSTRNQSNNYSMALKLCATIHSQTH